MALSLALLCGSMSEARASDLGVFSPKSTSKKSGDKNTLVLSIPYKGCDDEECDFAWLSCSRYSVEFGLPSVPDDFIRNIVTDPSKMPQVKLKEAVYNVRPSDMTFGCQ